MVWLCTLVLVIISCPAQLTTWSIKANTPVITVGYGKQVFTQALGLQFAERSDKRISDIRAVSQCLTCLGASVSWRTLPPGVLSYFNPLGWGRYNTPEPDDPSQKDPYEMYRLLWWEPILGPLSSGFSSGSTRGREYP